MPDRLGGHAPVEAGANLAAAQSSSPIAEIERVALGYERHSPGRSRRRPPLLVTATVRTMRARDAPLTSPRSARVTAVGRRSPGSPRPTVVDRVHDLSSVDSLQVNRRDPKMGMPELPLDNRATESLRAPSQRREHAGAGAARTAAA